MSEFKEFERTKNLLTQALAAALHSLPQNKFVNEARTQMKKALINLNYAEQTQVRRQRISQNQFEKWWGNVQAGTTNVAAQPMSAEAQIRSLNQLNSMIAEEKQKLEELEKQSNLPLTSPFDQELLND
jgi:hypothetical protein